MTRIQIMSLMEIIFFFGKNSGSENGENSFHGEISEDDNKLLFWLWKIRTDKLSCRMDKENLSSER